MNIFSLKGSLRRAMRSSLRGWLYVPIISVLMTLAPATIGAGSIENAASPPVTKGGAQSYIVLLEQLPLVAYEGTTPGLPATRPAQGAKIDPYATASVNYSAYLRTLQDKVLSDSGVPKSAQIHSYTVALNGFSVLMTDDQAEEMRNQPGVTKVMKDEWRYPDTDSSPLFLGLATNPTLWRPSQRIGYDGEGVIVGVIDSGIWPEHPSFADDGSLPPAPVLDDSRPNCEFGNAAHNPNDVPFTCNNKLVGARQMLDTYRALFGADPAEYDSARDDNGHGTHTASTAAGNDDVAAGMYGLPLGTVSGIAYRAQVIAYKGLGDLGGLTSDLAAAIDQAVADGVDVINYSIGGGASTPGADEIAFLFAEDAGVYVATSAGNSGPNPSTMGNPGTMPWMTTVGANTQPRFLQGTVVLGNGNEHVGASVTPGTGGSFPLVDAEFAGGDLCIPGSLGPEVVGKIVLCRRGGIARADKSLAVYLAGGEGTVFYNNNDVDNLHSDTHWAPTVHVDQSAGLAIKAYIASAGAGATAEIVGEQIGKWVSAPSMAIFSSRGPNPVAPDVIKPDITAPGVQILAGNTPTPIGSYPGELFQAIAGTSMASPHVAGVFALIKQANPDWSPAIAKSAVMTTAYQDVVDNDRTSQAGPFAMGSGHLDPGKKWQAGTVFRPGLAFDAGLFEYAAFTCGMEWGVFTPGSCDFLDSIDIPSDPSDLNLPSIGVDGLPGMQTVQRTVTSVDGSAIKRRYFAYVDEPPGYSVTVVPSILALEGGQSATYEVIITNESAPVDEWRFGSLTWKEQNLWGLPKLNGANVYSPIAVRSIPFYAPEMIEGSGESGSTSFDVNFGYTGSYSAAAHGLVPAGVTATNVVQDPDQSFDPGDGFSNLHMFNLSGEIHFRIALPPEATEPGADLDIFVFDPDGIFYAQSTNAGTDELIVVDNPMDGTWSVYVHGWATPGGDSDYDLHSWMISATPGGSLNIDSAPASATSGTTGTIDLSWSGATAGQWRFGAVSHTGPTGLMGLTLIEVDNR